MLRLCLVVVVMFVPLATGAEVPDKPQPLIRVSKETTFIVEPLDADGYVNYTEALNRAEAKGVTVENNFEIVVRELLGPAEIPETFRAEYYRRLGIKDLPTAPALFRTFSEFFTTTDADEMSQVAAEEGIIQSRPWSTKDFPRGEKWLKAMGPLLDRLVEGTKRPRYYLPYASETGTTGIARVSFAVSNITDQRQLMNGLMRRGYSRVGAGDVEAAWQDAQAVRRQAGLMCQRALLIDRTIGMFMDYRAVDLEIAILRSGKLSPGGCRQYLKALQGQPPLPTCMDTYRWGERLYVLDMIQCFARGGGKEWELVDYGVERTEPLAECDQIDWSRTLELMNAGLDQFVKIYSEPDPVRRRQMEMDAKQSAEEDVAFFKKTDSWKNVVLQGTPRERGEQFAKLLRGSAASSIFEPYRGDYRYSARRALLLIEYALELHKLERGEYPKALDALVPMYLKTIPLDPDSGRLPIYRLGGSFGFKLYCVGRNGQDNDGKVPEGVDPPEDDIVLERPPANVP